MRTQIRIISWRAPYVIHHLKITYNNDTEADPLHHEGHECLHSDYISDPDSSWGNHDSFIDDIANESDTKMLTGTPGLLASKETHSEGSREAVGDVNGFEQEGDIRSKDLWAPFTSAHILKMASWFIHNKVCKSQIHEYFTNHLGNS